ncbi:MAG: ATP-grasp domain-containing protein [Dorea sp.]|nr:ATP-grasp domain-containing protein [Dorea sp.]
MVKNVLVFPCGSEIALEVYRSLKHSKHFHLIGANSVSDHGRFVFEDYISGVPFVSEKQFVYHMKNIIERYHIDYIYPTMDYVITVLKEQEEELGCYVVASPVETTQICLSKRTTYDLLDSIVPIPKEYKLNDEMTFPVFCKPNIGYGSRKVKMVKDRETLETYLREHSDTMILEYLPGREYTVDCFTDKKGNLLFCGTRVRNRITNGISVNTQTIKDDEIFKNIAKQINSTLTFRGAWFIQLKKRADGELVLLEIASRMGGSSALYRARGINFAELTLFDAMDRPISVIDNGYNAEMDRAFDNCFKLDLDYDEVYIDYDDTIILNKCQYNLEAVKFLYYCRNKKIKITLLSMHEGNLEEDLKHFGLKHLFDKVIHITRKDSKAKYIDNQRSIFVDDSFTERKCVWEQKHIPVFSVDMIDCLMS